MLWHTSIFPSFVKMNNVSLFVCIYHILLIHSSLDDCFHVLSLGCFHVFAIMNSDTTWVFSCVFKTMFSIIWGVCEVWGFPGGSDGKEPAPYVGNQGSIPGSGKSSREGNGNPLQYSCLGNSMGREAWWATVHMVAKSWTQLSD